MCVEFGGIPAERQADGPADLGGTDIDDSAGVVAGEGEVEDAVEVADEGEGEFEVAVAGDEPKNLLAQPKHTLLLDQDDALTLDQLVLTLRRRTGRPVRCVGFVSVEWMAVVGGCFLSSFRWSGRRPAVGVSRVAPGGTGRCGGPLGVGHALGGSTAPRVTHQGLGRPLPAASAAMPGDDQHTQP
ncbi:hypothetical protein [Streptomyces lavendofoliae]|uniref:hypothetical protein n=1 Tax=Streptomyces lavendofoliae TaxID=67314 RepID=UPI00300EB582